MGADLLEFAAQENAVVVSGKKDFETAAKFVGRQLWGNSGLLVAGEKLPAESIQQNVQSKPVAREETFFTINIHESW